MIMNINYRKNILIVGKFFEPKNSLST